MIKTLLNDTCGPQDIDDPGVNEDEYERDDEDGDYGDYGDEEYPERIAASSWPGNGRFGFHSSLGPIKPTPITLPSGVIYILEPELKCDDTYEPTLINGMPVLPGGCPKGKDETGVEDWWGDDPIMFMGGVEFIPGGTDRLKPRLSYQPGVNVERAFLGSPGI